MVEVSLIVSPCYILGIDFFLLNLKLIYLKLRLSIGLVFDYDVNDHVLATWGVTIASLLGKPFNKKDTNVVYKCTLASSYNKIC
jgi:hypothetical protein